MTARLRYLYLPEDKAVLILDKVSAAEMKQIPDLSEITRRDPIIAVLAFPFELEMDEL